MRNLNSVFLLVFFVGVPQDWVNGIDAGILMVGSAGIGIAARASVLGGKTTAVSTYFPANDGVLGGKGTTYLYKGTLIDRYGGGSNSRYFSPVGTPAEMRALPQSTLGGDLRIDPPTPPGKNGPSYSHYHLNGGHEHLSPRNRNDPGFSQ